MSKHSCAAILFAILVAPMAMADQVVLKNGERLLGSIVKSDGKTLTIKSEFAGIVSVPQDVQSPRSLQINLFTSP